MIYSHLKLEKKWQKVWKQKAVFATNIDDFQKPKLYFLDMFPYPSGSGLHVGHLRGYLATDILTRMKRMQGFNVFHPIGFDSFGLPAEQYAISTRKDPAVFTDKNINYFIQQLQNFGFAYDFNQVVRTHIPNYYKWTQWTFLQFFKRKLAFLAKTEVNYCPSLNTVLANEEVVNLEGRAVSERGSYPVFREKREQWMLKISSYAEKLLSGLQNLNWPLAIKKAQQNWIGKKEGYTVEFSVKNLQDVCISLAVFNLQDLLMSDFVLLQVNNQLIDCFLSPALKAKLTLIRKAYSQKPILPANFLDKTPVGLFSGFSVWNPVQKQTMPVFFAEYVSVNSPFATKLGVAQDSVQDWFFAQKHQILTVDKLEQLKRSSAKNKKTFVDLSNDLKSSIKLKKTIFYDLRDWVFARQRYWGEPFPVSYQGKTILPFSENDLPLVLPRISDVKNFSNQKQSPLAGVSYWVKKGYDVNTMPQWAGSCWYFLAYLLQKKDGTFWPLNSFKAKQILNHWMPVDVYVGGAEHAVSHLLYARFWNLFLTEIGCYDVQEPFQKLKNQGLILASDGKKMSKSKGNSVDPNSFLVSHGADAVRLYEKFLGPFEKTAVWKTQGLDAARKWLARVYSLFVNKRHLFQETESSAMDYVFAQTVKVVSQSYQDFNFNVAVSQLMVFVNSCYKSNLIKWSYGIAFLQLLHPICPHLTEEIWSLWEQKPLLIESGWPTYDVKYLQKKTVFIAVQLNGKTKKVMEVIKDLSKREVIETALKKFNIKTKKIKDVFFVKNKIINFTS